MFDAIESVRRYLDAQAKAAQRRDEDEARHEFNPADECPWVAPH